VTISFIGWGPREYFQELVDPNTSSNNNDDICAQQSDVQIVSLCIPPQHDGDARVINTLNSNPTLDESQIARVL